MSPISPRLSVTRYRVRRRERGHHREASFALVAQRAQQRVTGRAVRSSSVILASFLTGMCTPDLSRTTRGADIAWMLPPEWWALPECHRSISRPLRLDFVSAQAGRVRQ
jgi:hypothetical protein